jgi:alanyl-tRNA synthetase
MNSDEIRSSYLKFFEEKGHTIIPSSSLIPKDNPTLLLTTAGVVQIQPYFLGLAEPSNKRLASCQKCFRTTDIEEVGDDRHNTFFEMLGNWSVGDYFKKEAIAWAWEFFMERLKIDPAKLWITIYLDDDEAFELWKAIGIPENRIVRFGAKDNFWGPVGGSGPCGPCSEIHYDFGADKGCGKPDCKPNCECGRFKEIWNLVFTQYNQDENGNRAPLSHPNIDTGMGLERISMVMQNKSNIYEIDCLKPLLDKACELTGKKYGVNAKDDTALRVIAEHGRSLSFLIADGVLPDNEGRGYVLRRLLRRGALFGKRLGVKKPVLSQIARTAIKKLHHIYPELRQRQDFIIKVIDLEEARFDETLNTGLQIIEELLARPEVKKSMVVNGADAFKLYDTYGFPVELTREIVAKSGLTVDMAGFEREMDKQRERARAAHKFENAAASGALKLDVKGTEFVGYHCLDQQAKVLKVIVNRRVADSVSAENEAELVLSASPFYGEMGGQLGDTGEIIGPNGKFTVSDTVRLPPDIIIHRGNVTEGSFKAGDDVRAVVNEERRKDIARNHTATHLLQAALRQVLGDHIQQRGSMVAPERLRFDFSHLTAMTLEEVKSVQAIVNEMIRRNLKVTGEEMDYKQAVAGGATALFDEKYGDVVRVMRIGEPAVSAELCGGTHIDSTGEIGYFHILSEGSVGAGVRRIEAVTGREAEKFVGQRFSSLEDIARILETTPEKVKDKLTGLLEELESHKKHKLTLERETARKDSDVLLAQTQTVKGIKFISARMVSDNQQVLRETADFLRDNLKSGIVVLGAISADRPIFIVTVTPDLVEKGYNAGNIIKEVSKVAGGGGGGKANFAQAGGRDKHKLDEALDLVKTLI